MKPRIVGLGMWIPERVRENSEWPAEFTARRQSALRELIDIPEGDRGDFCDRVVAAHLAAEAGDPFLGTTRRHVADDSMTAVEAEILAAQAALDDAGIDAIDIDLVCTYSVVPDRVVPPSSPPVAYGLGAHRALAVNMEVACATGLTQLDYACAMVETGRAKRVLCVQSHLITRTFAFMHPASPNVGDAVTAFVVAAADSGPALLGSWGVTHGEYYDAVTWCRPADQEAPWYKAGPAFYLGSRDPKGARALVQNAVRFGVETVQECCLRTDIAPQRIDVLASVQPRRWIPGAIAEILGIPAERAPQTFDELAHLGGSGVIMNLIEARRLGMLEPGAIVALYAQGAGFARMASLVRW